MNKHGRGVFLNSFIIFGLRNMDVSGQLHAMATLRPEKSLVSC